MPRTKPTTARAARPAESCSRTARSAASCATTGRVRSTRWKNASMRKSRRVCPGGKRREPPVWDLAARVLLAVMRGIRILFVDVVLGFQPLQQRLEEWLVVVGCAGNRHLHVLNGARESPELEAMRAAARWLSQWSGKRFTSIW